MLFLFIAFHGALVSAEILSIPESCLSQEVAPCLVKSGKNQILKSHSKAFGLVVEAETIVKILKFTKPFQFELLQGKMIVQSGSKEAIEFNVNEAPFHSKIVFVQFGTERRLQVYDIKNFILSEYELGLQKGQETVIRKSEFLAKRDMVSFLSNYFSSKKALVSYLKSIEASWKKEFSLQTNDQTIALQRSIASIEEADAESKRRAEQEAAKLKKVRSQFFYRTFYR